LAQLPAASPDAADLCFSYCSPAATARHWVRPAESARPVYTSSIGEVLYDDEDGSLWIDCGERARLWCHPAQGRTQVSVAQPPALDLWLLSHPLVTIPLMEMAKQRGLFSVHAAGMAIDGACVMLAGTSGSGKSTLALALARAGWDFLGDDLLFLTRDPGGVQVRAFPEAIDVTEQTIGLFPELADLHAVARPAGWPKWQVQPAARYDSRIAWACRPAALVFPRVARRATSLLAPIGRDEALLELVPDVLLTESHATQAHLDALAALVGQCACYRLDTGYDMDVLPDLLRPLVA
jgi:hypothetical protein